MEELLHRYGTRAEEIAAFERDVGYEPLKSASQYSRAEITFLCRNEWVNRLADILLRRTEMAMAGHVSLPVIHEIAEIAAAELSWDQERKITEIETTIKDMQRRHIRMAA